MWKLLMICFLTTSTSEQPHTHTTNEKEEDVMTSCQLRSHPFPVHNFNVRSCAMCYYYLFPFQHNVKKQLVLSPSGEHLMWINESLHAFISPGLITPDPDNSTSVDMICESLTDEECLRWRSCCSEAQECCLKELRQVSKNVVHTQYTESVLRSETQSFFCERTWDGFGCWRDTRPGTVRTISCPSFGKNFIRASAYTLVR